MAEASEPKYRQIAQDLMRKIESGVLTPGTQLPNEKEFRDEYTASRNTVRDAIKWLTIRGLVVTRPGQGTFVRKQPEPFVTTLSADSESGMAGGEGAAAFAEIRERLRQKKEQYGQDSPDEEPRASNPTVEVKGAPDFVAERLRIETDEEVIVRHQEFYVGSTAWSLQTTFYPMALVERGATDLLRPRDFTAGTVEYLRERLGLDACGSRLRIVVRAPNENEARFFGLPDDGRISVVSLIRTGYENRPGEGAHPYRVTFTILPADRNQFVINEGTVPKELAAPARDQ